MSDKAGLKNVKRQYEDFPYPPRDPAEEKQRLVCGLFNQLDTVNYFCFSGKRDFTQPIRVLIAGGGTGDATIHLAEQLRYNESAEIVHLDFSAASIAVAKERAKVRGLTNITWIQESLLKAPDLDLGSFDYINCFGVLHHLDDPDAGLKALTAVLKDEGAMGIMLYGQYGRSSIYQLQELLRKINKNIDDPQQKVDRCKAILQSLPATHPFRRSKFMQSPDIASDEGIYDLLLHSQDRAYTAPEVYEFVHQAGLKLLHFMPNVEIQGNLLYQPEAYLKDAALLDKIRQHDPVKQRAIAELIHGGIHKHCFFASRHIQNPPSVENLDNIPFFSSQCDGAFYQKILDIIAAADGQVTISLTYNKTEKLALGFPKSPHIEAIFQALDGKRSLKKLFDIVRKDAGDSPDDATLLKEFRGAYNALNIQNWLLLRGGSVPPLPSNSDLEQQIHRASV